MRKTRPILAVLFDINGTLLQDKTREYGDASTVYADVLFCLESLRDLPLGLISNGDQAQQQARLERAGIWSRFTCLVTSSGVGLGKPQPEIFQQACRELGVPIDAAMFVGDLLDTDARGATRAGMHGIWLNRADASIADDVPTIRSLDELASHVMQRKIGRFNGT